MLKLFAVAVGKLLRYSLRAVRRGGGSAFPGLIAAKIYPNLLRDSLADLPQGVVVVSGSAGKSSTTHYLVSLLSAHGLRVFTNPSTANIRQGLFSAVLKEAKLSGKLNYDIAVLELDEGHGAALSQEFPIRIAILTNVLSDQLDRFSDPEVVTEKLKQIASQADLLVVNADDKNLCQFAIDHPNLVAYGLSQDNLGDWPLPSYALNFGEHPEIEKSVFVEASESLFIKDSGQSFHTKQESIALALNLAAAYCGAKALLELDKELVTEILASKKGVFARNEISEISGRFVNLRLVQNPTSFQLNLAELSGEEQPLMLMAGRDIHDPSWLWTVNFSGLKKVDVVGGFNAAELALRLKVAGCDVGEVIPVISEASDRFFSLPGSKPTILFSADAMRRFRRYTKVAK
jgi:UDP-N-acetylmuramoylalanine-D-glutamate ligase